MAVPTSFASWTYNDSTLKSNGEPESSSFRLPITNLTAANVAAQAALVDTLTTAIEAVVLGVLQKKSVVYEEVVLSDIAANDQLAQREIKLLCRYHGVTSGSKFRCSIPTFDLALLPLHSEFLDLTADEGLALKSAFEAIIKSPNDDTEAVVLDSAQFVGRNT